MVSSCIVPACKDHKRKRRGGVSYYRFPVKDAERCKLWLKAVNNPKYVESSVVNSLKNLRVCSLHFKLEAFERHLAEILPHDPLLKCNLLLFKPESTVHKEKDMQVRDRL